MSNSTPLRYIGAHVSASGGYDLAIDRAIEIGANCVQIFSGSPRVWARRPLADLDPTKLFSKVKENSFGPIFTHALYLLNTASENPELAEKSIKAISYDLGFDAAIHGGGVVVHLGSHQGRGWAASREVVVKRLAQALETAPANATLLIENSAGQQGKLSSDLAEIRWLMDQLQSSQVGWCLDTCHAWAAGYALGATGEKRLVDAIETNELWPHLKVIHVNDSRDGFGTGRDRHANLGEGQIPQEELQHFLHNPQLLEVPLILEVPGLDDNGPDAANIQRLKAMAA